MGTLLFIIAINYLPNSVPRSAKTILYADDTNFLSVSDKLDQLELFESGTLHEESMWFEEHGLLSNNDKTQKKF